MRVVLAAATTRIGGPDQSAQTRLVAHAAIDSKAPPTSRSRRFVQRIAGAPPSRVRKLQGQHQER